MKQPNPADYVFGSWRSGVLFCPLCYKTFFGRVPPDSTVSEEEFEAQFNCECHWCEWPLWSQFEYLTGYKGRGEKLVDRSRIRRQSKKDLANYGIGLSDHR
jgi:hypothetical protein